MSRDETNTRTRILKATLDLLEAGPGHTVRMSDIAQRAGVSRQALYLHFATRADLLVATTFYLDALKDSDRRLVASRTAATGIERLEAFIDAWGNYIPEVYGAGRALMAMQDSDEAAKAAWSQRMQDMREGCQAAIDALARDGRLVAGQTSEQATDLLWTLLSVRSWESLVRDCGWPQSRYVATMKATARRLFVADDAAD